MERLSILKTMSPVRDAGGKVIGGDVIYNAVKAVITGGNFYGLELGAVENVSEALSQIVNLAKDPDWGKAYKTAETLARAIGIPAGKVRKIAEKKFQKRALPRRERGFAV